MNLAINPAPYIRSKNSTFKIMMMLLCGLGLVWLASIIYYFIQGSTTDGLFAILNVVICVVTCVVCEMLFFLPKALKEYKEDKEKTGNLFLYLLKKEKNSFGYISGIILALLLPVGVTWWQLIFTSIAAIAISKMLFGGFGYNIFNPAIFGRIFATLCFGSSFHYGNVSNGSSFNVFSGPTVLTNWANEGWNTLVSFNETSLLDLFLGNYRGTLGETFSLLIILIGIAFIVLKVIDFRITCSYLGTCLLSALLVAAVNGAPDMMTFVVGQMLAGGILFGAVFCLTDPVTSPTSPLGKIIYGVFAGFLTMLIRFMGSSAEGVAFSILFANMITPLIDNCFKGRTTDNFALKAGVTGGICTLLILVSCAYMGKVAHTTPTLGYEVTKKEDNLYNVKVLPYASQPSPGSSYITVDMDVEVNAQNKTVVSVKINDTGAGGNYGDYFLGLVAEKSEYLGYRPDKGEKLTELRDTYVLFDNPISFDEFRKYDLSYFDQNAYKEFSDVNQDLYCGATYTVSGYMFGMNRVLDVVEGK